MKRNLLSVLVLALVIANIVLSVIMMMSVTNTNKKTAQLITDIATVMNLELTSPGEAASSLAANNVKPEDTSIYSLGDMTIPLAVGSDGKQNYLVCKVAFSINTKHADYKKKSALLTEENFNPKAKAIVETVVSQFTSDEAKESMNDMQAEILTEIQKWFGSEMIYEVIISDKKFS